MEVVQRNEDRVWEQVLQALSGRGRLLKFQKLPRHELVAYLKAYSGYAHEDLRRAFALTQRQRRDELESMIEAAGPGRAYAMLHNLVGCMKCWVESESPNQNVRQRWKIANS